MKFVLSMFEREIAKAKKCGFCYFAKAIGSSKMRFGYTLGEAIAKAERDAKSLARKAMVNNPPNIQYGNI